MPDFQFEGQPFENPEAAANQTYAATPPGMGAGIGALFQESSTLGMINRYVGRSEYGGTTGEEGGLGRALAVAGEGQFAGMADQTALPSMQIQPSPKIEADEANKKYGPLGPDGVQVKIADAPIPEAVAQQIGQAKQDEITRQGVISRFQNARSWPVNFATGTAAWMMDPLNASSLFLPGFGEEAIAARLGGGIAARVAGSAIAGGATVAAAQAPLTAIKYGLGQQEASDYSLRDAFRDMAFAAAGGAVLGGAMRGIGEAISPEAKSLVQASAPAKYDAMKAATAQMSDGRPIDVEPIAHPDNEPPQTTVQNQGQLYKEGFAPGINQEDFVASHDAIYGAAAQDARAGAPETDLDQQLALAENDLATRAAPLHPEDQAAVDAASAATNQAASHSDGMTEAAACIGEAAE